MAATLLYCYQSFDVPGLRTFAQPNLNFCAR